MMLTDTEARFVAAALRDYRRFTRGPKLLDEISAKIESLPVAIDELAEVLTDARTIVDVEVGQLMPDLLARIDAALARCRGDYREQVREATRLRESAAEPDVGEVTDTYPEHDKLLAVREESQAIGEFLDWLRDERGLRVCEKVGGSVGYFHPVNLGDPTQLLAEFYDIDLQLIEQEKRAMLQQLREV